MTLQSHYKLDNAPVKIVQDAIDIWNSISHDTENNPDIKFYRQAAENLGHYSLGKNLSKYTHFRDHFLEVSSEEPCLVEFYVGCPKHYISSPHTDRGRKVAINIPIEVDLDKSTAFFGKYSDLSKYPQHKPDQLALGALFSPPEVINQRYDGNYVPEYYDTAILDNPVIFNPTLPHGGSNTADSQRVLMSLSWYTFSYETAISKLSKLGWISELS
jgi:hypothetical protein|tara:strand:+ start:4238 stop:4882 length:645 start_codon:yes stop_codon:yes gene_type:complete